jgi:hypothetical protein
MRPVTVVLVLLCGVASSAAGQRKQALIAHAPSALCTSNAAASVSIIQLIATPERFDRRCVRIIGYMHLEFESHGLYLTRADYVQAVTRNGLWLGEAADTTIYRSGINDVYVIVEGEFRADDHGHMGAFSGGLRQLTRLDRWPTSAEFDSMSREFKTIH